MLDEVPCSQATVHEYAYDAEGKLISSAFGATRYIYDAEGNRVAKQNYLTGVITNQYLYDTAGRMTVEIDGSGNVLRQEIYAGNRYLGTLQNGTMYYSHANWLGTDSARSDSGGLLCQTSGSLPFGDALQVSGNCFPSPKFYTGKERDTESGLDYFGARYYGSSMGRWMSPDWADKPEAVPYSSLENPQSLNLYGYVLNNPLGGTDPDGHCGQQQTGGTSCPDVKVTATVIQKPTVQTNTPVNGQNATGVAGKIELTVTANGKPLSGVQVTETNKETMSENGQKVPATLVEGHATTTGDGKVDDVVGNMSPSNGSAKDNAAIMKDLNTNVNTSSDKQTLTLALPNGPTCTCTDSRTLTNAGSNNTPSSHYTLTVTQPTQPVEKRPNQ